MDYASGGLIFLLICVIIILYFYVWTQEYADKIRNFAKRYLSIGCATNKAIPIS